MGQLLGNIWKQSYSTGRLKNDCHKNAMEFENIRNITRQLLMQNDIDISLRHSLKSPTNITCKYNEDMTSCTISNIRDRY